MTRTVSAPLAPACPTEPWRSRDPRTDPSPDTLLSVRGLCKYFPIKKKGFFKKEVGSVRACDDVSFDLKSGETLGLVGESGCGKTTTGRAILRALTPTSGQVLFRVTSAGDEYECGQGAARSAPLAPDTRTRPSAAVVSDGATANPYVDLAQLNERTLKALRPRMQMIFQDPFASLNPRMTVGDIVAEPLVIHKMGDKAERTEKVMAMLAKVGLKPEHRTRYPHAFSGGQRQRIGIARALIMHPELVVCDEAVSALDVSVQAQVINLLQDLQQELGLTYIFIAHNLGVVKHICDRIAVMYAGRIVELATTEQLFGDPRHPYTRALLSAVPDPDPDKPMNMALSGEVADPGNLPPGCAFHPRCPVCKADCEIRVPQLIRQPDGRIVSCLPGDGGEDVVCEVSQEVPERGMP
jgi:peptide/nickel transport system ATP-binding protein